LSPLLELDCVRFAYPGRPPVLDGVQLRVSPGDRLAVTGPNGAGKSTLLRLIVGLERPQAGQIAAFGRACTSEADFREVRRRVGLVFQDPDDQLFCPTVLEDVAFGPLNLGHPPAAARAVAERTLDRLGLAGFAERITHKLSGGEKRLVSLAAVLAMEPEVLLLDEPSNFLDEATTARLVAILRNLDQALVVVSHDRHFRRKVSVDEFELEAGRLVPYAARCRHAEPSLRDAAE
jgi:cobalt/nickel transport system ATP-binding protein